MLWHLSNKDNKEKIWIKRFLLGLVLNQLTYVVFCGSQSAMDLIKCWLKKGHIDDNVVDMLTKVVPRAKLELCAMLAGMEMN